MKIKDKDMDQIMKEKRNVIINSDLFVVILYAF